MLPFTYFVGIYFGLKYPVLVLIPLSIIGAIALLVRGGLYPSAVSTAFDTVLLPLLLMQVGYIMGLTGRDAYRYLCDRLGLVHPNRV